MRHVWPLFLALSSCTTLLLQDDGFRKRIPRECFEADCTDLLTEAHRRVRDCQENTVGKVRCDDAQADLKRLESLGAGRVRVARGPEESIEDRVWREKQEKQKERQREAQEEARARRKEEELRERDKEAARVAEMRRLDVVMSWQRKAWGACLGMWSTERCTEPPVEVHEKDDGECKTECANLANERAREVIGKALRTCVSAFVDAEGKGATVCAVNVPDGADARHKDAVTACSSKCAEKGKVAWEERKREIAEEKKRVKCCDGTRSPSCTYGQGSMRGCCSHHGGICGG